MTTDNTKSNNRFKWDDALLRQATAGNWVKLGDTKITSQCISTDTRKIKKDDVFLALKGENFDGHDYIKKAKELGAIAAVVSQPNTCLDLPQLVVKDTRIALGELGQFVRKQYPKLKVVALTGSSGKTTVKEMLGSILSNLAPTLITRGNLNNDLGVPMMLLELTSQHKFAVLELGANHVGEIAYTTRLVEPDIACVLNIGTAHIGEFGGRDTICTAKSEIFAGLNQIGTAVLPSFDEFFAKLHQAAKKYTKHTLTFAADDVADVYAKNISLGSLGSKFSLVIEGVSKPVSLALAGEHNITNALAAAACAYALDVDINNIANGLTRTKPSKGRLNKIELGDHVLIDDTYNANPNAVIAAAKVLLGVGGINKEGGVVKPYKVLVLGDIGELGEQAEQLHAQLGRDLKTYEPDLLVCIGVLMAHTAKAAQQSGINVLYFPTKADALDEIKNTLASKEHVAMLFKGSRTATMETLIADIKTANT